MRLDQAEYKKWKSLLSDTTGWSNCVSPVGSKMNQTSVSLLNGKETANKESLPTPKLRASTAIHDYNSQWQIPPRQQLA